MSGADLDAETCIVLAGGRGTRLHEATGGGNKHLLPIAGAPALRHVLEPLARSYTTRPGIVLTNADAAADIRNLLDAIGLDTWHVVQQPAPDGTLSALRCTLPLLETPYFSVHLGDNLIAWREIPRPGAAFLNGAAMEIFTREIPTRDAARFAVVTVSSGAVESVHEKPDVAVAGETVLALTGFARFNTELFRKFAPAIPKSPRGEYEVTSLLDRYLKEGIPVAARPLEAEWLDYGTPESLREAERILHARKEIA